MDFYHCLRMTLAEMFECFEIDLLVVLNGLVMALIVLKNT